MARARRRKKTSLALAEAPAMSTGHKTVMIGGGLLLAYSLWQNYMYWTERRYGRGVAPVIRNEET